MYNPSGVAIWTSNTGGHNCGSGCAAYVTNGQLAIYAGSTPLYFSPFGGLRITADQPYVKAGTTPIGVVTNAGCISTQDQRNQLINSLISLQQMSQLKWEGGGNIQNDLSVVITTINAQLNRAAAGSWNCTDTGAAAIMLVQAGGQISNDLHQEVAAGRSHVYQSGGNWIISGTSFAIPDLLKSPIQNLSGFNVLINTAVNQMFHSSYYLPGFGIGLAGGLQDANTAEMNFSNTTPGFTTTWNMGTAGGSSRVYTPTPLSTAADNNRQWNGMEMPHVITIPGGQQPIAGTQYLQ